MSPGEIDKLRQLQRDYNEKAMSLREIGRQLQLQREEEDRKKTMRQRQLQREYNEKTFSVEPPHVELFQMPATQTYSYSEAPPGHQYSLHGSAAHPEPSALPMNRPDIPTLAFSGATALVGNHKPDSTPEKAYDIERPTCSLNIVCYRRGAQGCVLRPLETILASRFESDAAFQETLAKNPQLVATDISLFRQLHRLYWREMCSFWRRYLSLKTLVGFRLLEVRQTSSDDVQTHQLYHVKRY
jgi:hypothetical protein